MYLTIDESFSDDSFRTSGDSQQSFRVTFSGEIENSTVGWKTVIAKESSLIVHCQRHFQKFRTIVNKMDISKSATKLCIYLRDWSLGRHPDKIDADKETPVAITATALNMRKKSAPFALWYYFVKRSNRVYFAVKAIEMARIIIFNRLLVWFIRLWLSVSSDAQTKKSNFRNCSPDTFFFFFYRRRRDSIAMGPNLCLFVPQGTEAHSAPQRVFELVDVPRGDGRPRVAGPSTVHGDAVHSTVGVQDTPNAQAPV